MENRYSMVGRNSATGNGYTLRERICLSLHYLHVEKVLYLIRRQDSCIDISIGFTNYLLSLVHEST